MMALGRLEQLSDLGSLQRRGLSKGADFGLSAPLVCGCER